jgi:hypothetical protein
LYNTRVHIVVYIVGGLFLALAFALCFAYYRTRHSGLLLMAGAYGLSGALAIGHVHWWPLVVGFIVVWVFRFMGYEPEAPRDPGA